MINDTLVQNARKDGQLDVVRLANDLGITVRPIDGFDALTTKESAYIRYEDGSFVIYVNPSQTKQRQRFSVAHELGHFAKHQEEIKRKGKVDRESTDSLDKGEEEAADKFAAELLIPAHDLKAYITENKINGKKIIDKNSVERLAKRYDVSLFAMILRLRELGFYVPFINVYA